MNPRTVIFSFLAVFAAMALGAFVWARAAAPTATAYPHDAIVIEAQP